MILVFFKKYLIYSVETSNGRTDYYYYDAITWIVAFVAVSWVAWFFIKRAIRARKLLRKRSRPDKSLRKIKKAKSELTQRFLRGFSQNIHAVGIGKLSDGEHCIQIFLAGTEMGTGSDSRDQTIPRNYKGIPILIFEMPQASFLDFEVRIDQEPEAQDKKEASYISNCETPPPFRDRIETVLGGVSGANANLNGQCGTIGYFCKRKSIFPRKSDTYLLSNTHVFVDLRNPEIDEHDLIVQPSPGEPTRSHPIGELTNYSAIKLDNDIDDGNRVDAAIAKLWRNQNHENLIPMIGKIKGYAKKEDVEVGEFARKFGRTTGFTAGNVFSLDLDIWIKYDRTGQSAFFEDQIMIEPNSDFEKFVDKGDSGSLVVDGENFASGLVFAGASGKLNLDNGIGQENDERVERRVDNFGVANPISDVLSALKLEFADISES